MIRGATLVLLCAATAWAADVDGSWQLTYTTGNGLQREAMLELKTVDGKLSGTLSSDRGSARIEAGAINSDSIWFSLLRKGNGDEIKVEFKGTIENGGLKLNMQFGKREPVTVVGRRI